MLNPFDALLPTPPPPAPFYRWGYVTDDDPFEVILDTETAPVRCSSLVSASIGERVFVLVEGRRATVLGKVPMPVPLNSLSDVDTTGVGNRSLLRYNSTSGLWEDETPEWLPVGGAGGTFTGGWSNYNTSYYTAAAIRYEGSRVHMRGLIKAGSMGAAIWLPAGAAPLRDHIFCCAAENGLARVDATQQGAGDSIRVNGYFAGGTNGYVSLDGISWDRI